MQSHEARMLRQFILKQDQTNRYILLLHYYDQLTTREISHVLELAESQVNKRLAQLQQQAREMIQLATSGLNPQSTTPGVSAFA